MIAMTEYSADIDEKIEEIEIIYICEGLNKSFSLPLQNIWNYCVFLITLLYKPYKSS